MKTALTLVLLTVVACASMPVKKERTEYPSQVFDSLVRVTYHTEFGTATCTGFMVAPTIALTAHHCLPRGSEYLLVDGIYSFVLWDDVKHDIAAIQTFGINKPILKAGTLWCDLELYICERVYAFGFGYALPHATVVTGFVMDPSGKPDGLPDGILTNFPFIPGQSGGPVVNQAGEVVGMVQGSFERIGYAAKIETLLEVLGRFWVGSPVPTAPSVPLPPQQTVPLPFLTLPFVTPTGQPQSGNAVR